MATDDELYWLMLDVLNVLIHMLKVGYASYSLYLTRRSISLCLWRRSTRLRGTDIAGSACSQEWPHVRVSISFLLSAGFRAGVLGWPMSLERRIHVGASTFTICPMLLAYMFEEASAFFMSFSGVHFVLFCWLRGLMENLRPFVAHICSPSPILHRIHVSL